MSTPPVPAAPELAAELRTALPLQHLRAPAVLDDVAARWCERQRVWHGPDHLRAMLQEISTLPQGEERDVLQLAAVYHDAIYDPRGSDNEEQSAVLLLSHAADPRSPFIARVVEIIVASKWGEPPATPLAQRFFAMDTQQLSDACPLHERLAYERAIFREFQFAPWTVYREKRAAFLQNWALKFPEHRRGAAECLELLAGMSPRIAVYPGSFAPFHLGHLSILRQAESMFDKVIVAVGINRQKAGALETADARFESLQSQLWYHEVAAFSGLLTKFMDGRADTVVRGVRDGTDLEAELRYSRFLNELQAETRVVWISCEAELQHLSSSAIRELESIEPGAGARYVPERRGIYQLADTVSSAAS